MFTKICRTRADEMQNNEICSLSPRRHNNVLSLMNRRLLASFSHSRRHARQRCHLIKSEFFPRPTAVAANVAEWFDKSTQKKEAQMMNLLIFSLSAHVGFRKAMDHFSRASRRCHGNVRTVECRRFVRRRRALKRCRWTRRNRLRRTRSRRWTSASSCTWTFCHPSQTPSDASSPVDRCVSNRNFLSRLINH